MVRLELEDTQNWLRMTDDQEAGRDFDSLQVQAEFSLVFALFRAPHRFGLNEKTHQLFLSDLMNRCDHFQSKSHWPLLDRGPSCHIAKGRRC
jgi:hypothetical protein